MMKARAQQESESVGVVVSRPTGGDFVTKKSISLIPPSDFRMWDND